MAARLVVIGDGLSQGVRSGAITHTHLSYPAIAAAALGIADFRTPGFEAENGVPLNLEVLIRQLETHVSPHPTDWTTEAVQAATRDVQDGVSRHWHGSHAGFDPHARGLNHLLASWGFQLNDLWMVTPSLCEGTLVASKTSVLGEGPADAFSATAMRVLNPQRQPSFDAVAMLGMVREIARQENGIERLLVQFGLSHVLPALVTLDLTWTRDRDLVSMLYDRQATIWKRDHFRAHFDQLARELRDLPVGEVVLATVPRMTVAPVVRGLPSSSRDPRGYYDFYTHFWIWDDEFDPTVHPHLTRDRMVRIDATIDAYNEIIRQCATAHGWRVFELGALYDTLAIRRTGGQTRFAPPRGLVHAMSDNPLTRVRFTSDDRLVFDARYPRVNMRYVDPDLRFCGGFFSLDGIHPTVLGSGVIADVFLRAMGDSAAADRIDWTHLLNEDSLMVHPPNCLTNLRAMLEVLADQGPLKSVLRQLAGVP